MTTQGMKCQGCGYECEFADEIAKAGRDPRSCPICKTGLCPDCMEPDPGKRVDPFLGEPKPTRSGDDLLAPLAHAMILHWAAGAFTLQKFTCINCGARQTISVPNKVYLSGTCEECGADTDLQHRGGGFVLIATNAPDEVRRIAAEIDAIPPAYLSREGRA